MATYAIGDIHGQIEALKTLIKKLNLKKEDHVIFLGDYVGRKSQWLEVLKYAESVLSDNQKTNDDEDLEDIAKAFDMVLHQVMQGFLTLNAEKLAFLQNNSLKNDVLSEDNSNESFKNIVVAEEILAE